MPIKNIFSAVPLLLLLASSATQVLSHPVLSDSSIAALGGIHDLEHRHVSLRARYAEAAFDDENGNDDDGDDAEDGDDNTPAAFAPATAAFASLADVSVVDASNAAPAEGGAVVAVSVGAASATESATATAAAATSTDTASASASASATVSAASGSATVFPGTAPTLSTAGAPAQGDLFVLNYALTLEFLEASFYKQALDKFDANAFKAAGFDPAIRDQMLVIKGHEDTHVTALTGVIETAFGKGTAVGACEYNFNFDTVAGFVATAAALERTGVSAYTGAIAFIQSNAVKTAGAAIATVEGRHAALLNAVNAQKQGDGSAKNINPIPASFDTPLGFAPILSIAAPFIKSCPFALPVAPFPALSLANPNGAIGDKVSLLFTATLTQAQLTTPGALQCDILFGLAQKRTPVTISKDAKGNNLADCVIPPEAAGFEELMVFIVNQDQDVTIENDKHVVAGPTTFQTLEKTLVKVSAQ
ncbi:ferritin-like domain-containing protein [Fimicolochytrium jonesii]|uniref:ferritin-like domain-containing protein n=1 Tax=Fimicolochytrium jonesii TaxID=1396493 RepID=UPI0022FEF612|nr:ferritin-like domain-containing protein [Fimicolochytrium jonesii]KAI8825227.1 ferritin-like domain-containing protein [Fimicolochytrium jonesii]